MDKDFRYKKYIFEIKLFLLHWQESDYLSHSFHCPKVSEPPDLRPYPLSRPSQMFCLTEALLLCGEPKYEEHRASLRGSQLYLLSATKERREKGRMGGV